MVVTNRNKEVVQFIYGCYICDHIFRDAKRLIDHVQRIHGYVLPTRSVGRRRPAHPDYEYQNDPNGEHDCEHYSCPSCWFHTPANREGLDDLAEHVKEAHHPTNISQDNEEENEESEEEEETTAQRTRRPSSGSTQSNPSETPTHQEDLGSILQKLTEVTELFKHLMR
ncbi:uncharacterized protein B0P05DRAFT_573388 [Gilbertella persicaria]|uniref:uncharacterized protein n=1 Tax=Gilbertella persicaria TaxID=101096 RepID=UPI002220D68F|nr:uncharacterized protein B0P05DRAFT_573388 [Gilbertella persicaria]KAI8069750.1 hypothetical protein B0P05DRAFT_573388 [Gilbertella persicaria]